MADNVKISQLNQITEIADNDILIVNDASTGKTRTTTKANLLSGLTKNVTDNGDDVVIKNDVKVNNDLTLDGDFFTTGKLTFGQLHDYANDISVLGFADSQNAVFQNDDLVPTTKAVKAYLTSITDSITSSTSEIAESAVAIANQSLLTSISSNEDGILALSSQLTSLSVTLTDQINASSTAESELRALISSNDSGVTVLSQRMDALDVSLQTAGLDSDFVTTAISSATDTLTARIDQDSDSLSIIASQVTALEASLETVGVDSAVVLQISGEAINELSTRIDQDSARLSVVSQEITQLSASLETAGLDSDFVTSAISNATESLTSRIDQDSDALSIVSDKVTVLEASLTEGIDSDLVLQVSGGAINELSTRIDQDSARLSVVSEEVTTLTGSLTDVQNNVATNVSAVSGLTARIDQDSDRLSVVSQDITQLQADLSNIDISGVTANADALNALTARVDQDSDRLSAVSSDITELSSSIDDAVATASQGLVTQVEAIDSDITNIQSKFFVTTNVNGHISGLELLNTGETSSFVITADTFKIVNASNNAVTPFSIDGNQIALNGDVTINGTLSATQLVGDVAEIYSFSKGSGAAGGTVGSFGLTAETQEIYIPPPTGGVSKRPFIDGRIILSPFSGAQYQNYLVEIRYVSGPTFETTLTGYLGDVSTDFSGRRNYARYSGNYTDRVVSGGILYTASDNARSFYGANYDVTTNETLFLYDDDDGPIGNGATWTLAPSSATSTYDLNRVGMTSGGGTGENARISNVVIPFSGILPSTTAPQGITLAITWKVYGYVGSANGYLRSLEANYGYQR